MFTKSSWKTMELSNKGPWQCFHCGFVAKTPEEGEAHFGDVGGLPPLCMMWANMSEKERISEFQQLEFELAGTRNETMRDVQKEDLVECPRYQQWGRSDRNAKQLSESICLLCKGAYRVDSALAAAYTIYFGDSLPLTRGMKEFWSNYASVKLGFGAVSVHLVPEELREKWLIPTPLFSRFAMLRNHGGWNDETTLLIRQIWDLWDKWRA